MFGSFRSTSLSLLLVSPITANWKCVFVTRFGKTRLNAETKKIELGERASP